MDWTFGQFVKNEKIIAQPAQVGPIFHLFDFFTKSKKFLLCLQEKFCGSVHIKPKIYSNHLYTLAMLLVHIGKGVRCKTLSKSGIEVWQIKLFLLYQKMMNS